VTTAIVTATYGLTGTDLTCDVSDVTDDPAQAVLDAIEAGARWVRIEPWDETPT
jgi:hypothetical protein